MNEITVNGRAFWRALAYAFQIVPTSEQQSKLAQVVFLDRRVICSDGRRWFVGWLPSDAILETPLVVAKESIDELLLGLAYADKIARRHGGSFFVKITGLEVELHYAEKLIRHRLVEVPVGYIPKEWVEPVPPDAPILGSLPALACGDVGEAVKWWRSWDKDYGSVTFRGLGVDHPARFDIEVDGDQVSSAFLLPAKRAAAQLPPDEPLFAGAAGPMRGQSILDLTLEEQPDAELPQIIRIGELEWNVTGLPGYNVLLQSGPCDHRDTHEPCAPCTEIAVAKARLSKGPKKRNKKAPKLELIEDAS